MVRTKSARIREVGELDNVFVKPEDMKGKWKEFFGGGDVVLELACAAGGYTLALAEFSVARCDGRNFVGVDKKGERIWIGAKMAERRGLKNVAFVRCLIERLDEYFAPGEVDEIWITFPDPHSKPSRAGRRLTSGRFLEIYRRVMRPGGVIHLKTDDEALFDYSIDTARENGCTVDEIVRNVHGGEPDAILQILTYYEKKWIADGRKIFYYRYRI